MREVHDHDLRRPRFVEDLTEAERDELFGEVDALIKELTESGELLGAEALAEPAAARTIRVRDGVPAITDGPFVEAKEQFAGYLLVDVENEERALDIAARWPDAKLFVMEVRKVI
ncbi:YciI family protein [Actinoallomurus iriomotensis]|uniref:YciI family protein n=1 Tax=Actinoallomurus iriomotensis TaxID=478107 RepID=UPI00255267F8|nr:YciI family protein [Actinoallomurus iriomotensis]